MINIERPTPNGTARAAQALVPCFSLSSGHLNSNTLYETKFCHHWKVIGVIRPIHMISHHRSI